jgi:hypothetical protein
MQIDDNATELEIITDFDKAESKTIITKIEGLNALKKLQKISIIYFDEFHLSNIEIDHPIFLIIQNTKVYDINQVINLNQNINAIAFQSCDLPKNLIVDNKNNNLEYLEISNCGIKELPTLKHKIPIVNLSFNNISQINDLAQSEYTNADTVVLIGNRVKITDKKFICFGELHNLIPEKWYAPQ